MKESTVHTGRTVALGLFILMFAGLLLLTGFAQNEDIYRMPGKVVAEGTNQTPVGVLGLKTYRVEEVQLSKPVNVEIGGRNVRVDRAYKVIIKGSRFPVRNLPAIIWINDTPLKYAQESADLSEVTAVAYDRSLLRDGAVLAFSFGEGKESYTELPERLQFNANR